MQALLARKQQRGRRKIGGQETAEAVGLQSAPRVYVGRDGFSLALSSYRPQTRLHAS